ncbi:hypothetical protein [Kocuria palustris]|uniref:hypothetical protein n=1 Tax=Kocuria palustris TaxID=71999 RepID=UPI0011A1DCA4|nr:hypothetical protein [Kocuria palustris]
MARDDAGEGRGDAPWDFDLPDLGASTTPEHHRRGRPRTRASASSSGTPGPAGGRRLADEPLDIEALDAEPVDQGDDQLVPPSADDLSTHGPGASGPTLPDEVPDDRDAPGRPGGDSPRRRPTAPDDDLLPSWATGRSVRRRARSTAGTPGGQGRSGPAAAGDAGRGAFLDDPDSAPAQGARPGGGARRHRSEPDAQDHRGGRRDQDDRDSWDDRDGWDDRWAADEDEVAPAPLWRRLLDDPGRLTRILIPAAILLLVIALLIWILNALTGGGEEEQGADEPAAVAESSEDPFDGFSARPEDETTDGASGPAARACGDALSLEASTDEQSYPEDQDPVLIMTLENTGEDPCMVNAGTARMDFRVVSGSDTVFDSQHCQIEGQDRPIELEPGETQSARMQWDRQRSAPGCSGEPEPAAAGGYELEVSLGEASAAPVEFTLEDGADDGSAEEPGGSPEA